VKLVRLLSGLVVVSALAYGANLAWDSPALRVQRIEVAGGEHVGGEQVTAASGVETGTHLLSLSTFQISARLQRIPWVATAHVERIIPSKLRIRIEERTPAAVLFLPDQSYLVDEEGVVLEAGSEGPVKIFDLPADEVIPGARIHLAQYRDALAVARSLDPKVQARVVAVRAPAADGITLELDDGGVVLFGSADALEEKNYALTALLDEAASKQRRVASIDVRVADRPALRLR
jgi:cell division protein FtsQ